MPCLLFLRLLRRSLIFHRRMEVSHPCKRKKLVIVPKSDLVLIGMLLELVLCSVLFLRVLLNIRLCLLCRFLFLQMLRCIHRPHLQLQALCFPFHQELPHCILLPQLLPQGRLFQRERLPCIRIRRCLLLNCQIRNCSIRTLRSRKETPRRHPILLRTTILSRRVMVSNTTAIFDIK